ncbi:MAG: hypothetical protein N4Q30_00795 [Neisseriaceae bacterium]|nr:hypothetical protein [Neisseriaceae bacterium]
MQKIDCLQLAKYNLWAQHELLQAIGLLPEVYYYQDTGVFSKIHI